MKICLDHIAKIQTGRYRTSLDIDSNPVVRRVIDSNPLLEAFGNAKTRRNDNSSRFGKYLQLQFDHEAETAPCQLVGSKCDVYLLEKNRVVQHDGQERNFHIFYQLLAASDETKTVFWEGLRGTSAASFRYVGKSSTTAIDGVADEEQFQKTLDALKLVGVANEKLAMLMQAICITLQLGNLEFIGDVDTSKVVSDTELEELSSLMGLPASALSSAFTERTFTAAREAHKVPLGEEAAYEARDALAKDIYQKVFSWLVRAINDSTSAELAEGKQHGTIGLLDIFGFESFARNGFEQLCINYANEKLQQKFNSDIFETVMTEYKSEGIDLDEVRYNDNSFVLDLIEGRTGLLNLLNEECIRPKGNDFDYVHKALKLNGDLVPNRTDQLSFRIQHFAGIVEYDAEGFVAKNLDTLHNDLQECVTRCDNEIVKSPSAAGRFVKHPPHNPLCAPTTWTQYKSHLSLLMDRLHATQSRYIRCIKPNKEKKPGLMEHKPTVEQLRCAGIVAGITISRSTFPTRLENSLVLTRFSHLVNGLSHTNDPALTLDERKAMDCKALLSVALRSNEQNGVKAFAVGKTKTYFRAGALEYLESQRMEGLDMASIVTIQRMIRGWLVRSAGQPPKQPKIDHLAEYHRIRDQQAAAAKQKMQEQRELRREQHAQTMQAYQKELRALELEMLAMDTYRLETSQALARRQEECHKEKAQLEEELTSLQQSTIRQRKAEQAKQESILKSNSSMILRLKRENKRLRQTSERYKEKCTNEARIHEKLSDSTQCDSRNIGVAEEETVQVQTRLDIMEKDFAATKALNQSLKAELRKQQDEYLEVATQRLQMQKNLKRILELIDQHRSKSQSLVSQINWLVEQTECLSKAEMASVEAEYEEDDPTAVHQSTAVCA